MSLLLIMQRWLVSFEVTAGHQIVKYTISSQTEIDTLIKIQKCFWPQKWVERPPSLLKSSNITSYKKQPPRKKKNNKQTKSNNKNSFNFSVLKIYILSQMLYKWKKYCKFFGIWPVFAVVNVLSDLLSWVKSGISGCILLIITIRQTRHVGHCWRSRDELISDILLCSLHHIWPRKSRKTSSNIHTYNSSVRIRDVALKTCQRRWTIGRSGERVSRISVLAARHDGDDDDDDDDYKTVIYISTCM